jgi:hypothetical protein
MAPSTAGSYYSGCMCFIQLAMQYRQMEKMDIQCATGGARPVLDGCALERSSSVEGTIESCDLVPGWDFHFGPD